MNTQFGDQIICGKFPNKNSKKTVKFNGSGCDSPLFHFSKELCLNDYSKKKCEVLKCHSFFLFISLFFSKEKLGVFFRLFH